jgi:hypothetical protein
MLSYSPTKKFAVNDNIKKTVSSGNTKGLKYVWYSFYNLFCIVLKSSRLPEKIT